MVLQLQSDKTKQINSRAIKVGFIAPFGRSNLGCIATQVAMIQNLLKFCPDAKIYAFSLNPEDTEKRLSIPCFALHRLGDNKEWWLGKNSDSFAIKIYNIGRNIKAITNPFLKKILYPALALVGLLLELNATIRAYKNLRKLELDILILAGGGVLSDNWWGPQLFPYMVFLWANLARFCGVRFSLVSVGAGPVTSKLSKILFKNALSTAFYCSYRDEYSKNYIENIVGYKNGDSVYPDLVHSLQIEKYSSSSIMQRQSETIVGLNIMYTHPCDGVDSSSYLSYMNKMAQFVSWLIQQQYKICLFPGCIYGDHGAIKYLREILDKNGVVYYEGQIVENPIYSVDDLMWQLSATNLVVASRFHSVLMSLISNKPVLAVSYHRKVNMLMADTGQKDYCLSIEDFDVDTLKARFIALEANKDKIKQQLETRIQQYRSQLDQQYEAFFSSI